MSENLLQVLWVYLLFSGNFLSSANTILCICVLDIEYLTASFLKDIPSKWSFRSNFGLTDLEKLTLIEKYLVHLLHR
jgi:hypothetical protein